MIEIPDSPGLSGGQFIYHSGPVALTVFIVHSEPVKGLFYLKPVHKII